MSDYPFSADPRSRKIVLRFRPGVRTGAFALKPETYFRQWVKPIAGWLVIANGEEYAVPTAELMWPSNNLESVVIVDPHPDDECWECLKPRSDHEPFLLHTQRVFSGGYPQHHFDWAPIDAGHRAAVVLNHKFEEEKS